MHLLSIVSGDAMVNAIIRIVVYGVAFWILNWAIDACKVQEPFKTVGKVLLILAAVIICLRVLFSLEGPSGRPFSWW